MPVIITLADGSGEIAVVAVSNSESRVPHVETASDAGLTTQGLLAAITEFVCSAARGPALATTIEIEADDRLRALADPVAQFAERAAEIANVPPTETDAPPIRETKRKPQRRGALKPGLY